ncbi:MAG TPA: PQQ-binding-like beta-propeller repeat protein [Ktedonobacterales bacterium]|nr:PQQ-binding-like beta-propeller repeat protein [Ktedonobacterales bacterium]
MNALRSRRQRERAPQRAHRAQEKHQPWLRPRLLGLLLALCGLLSACGLTSGSGGQIAQGKTTPTTSHSSATVYVSSDSIYALRASDGVLRWRAVAGDCGGSTIVASGVLYTTAVGAVCALNTQDGSLRWRVTLNGAVHSSLVLADDLLFYVGNPAQDRPTTGWIGAVRARDGQAVWRYMVGLVAEAEPVVAEGVVYIGTAAGVLYALRASDGHLLWSVATLNHRAIRASVAVADDVVYSDAENGSLSALRASDGHLLWRVNGVSGMPVVADGVVYLSGPLTALRASDGAILWRAVQLQTVTGLTVTDGVLYLGTAAIEAPDGTATGGYVYALNLHDGTVLWRAQGEAPDPPPTFGTPLMADGLVYVGSITTAFPTAPPIGAVYALDARDGTLRWKYRLLAGVAAPRSLTVVP